MSKNPIIASLQFSGKSAKYPVQLRPLLHLIENAVLLRIFRGLGIDENTRELILATKVDAPLIHTSDLWYCSSPKLTHCYDDRIFFHEAFHLVYPKGMDNIHPLMFCVFYQNPFTIPRNYVATCLPMEEACFGAGQLASPPCLDHAFAPLFAFIFIFE